MAKFNIAMTGTYHDFGKFIGYVANFPFIANVSELQVNSTSAANIGERGEEEGDNFSAKPTMTANFVLSTYFVKQEERLEQLSL